MIISSASIVLPINSQNQLSFGRIFTNNLTESEIFEFWRSIFVALKPNSCLILCVDLLIIDLCKLLM